MHRWSPPLLVRALSLRRRVQMRAAEHGWLQSCVVEAALAGFIHFIHCSGVPLRPCSVRRWIPPLLVRALSLRRRIHMRAAEHGVQQSCVVEAALADFIHFIHCSGVPLRPCSVHRWSPPLLVRALSLRRRVIVWAAEHGWLQSCVVEAALADFIHFIHCSGVPLRPRSVRHWKPPLLVRALSLRRRVILWAAEHGWLQSCVVEAALAGFIHFIHCSGVPLWPCSVRRWIPPLLVRALSLRRRVIA